MSRALAAKSFFFFFLGMDRQFAFPQGDLPIVSLINVTGSFDKGECVHSSDGNRSWNGFDQTYGTQPELLHFCIESSSKFFDTLNNKLNGSYEMANRSGYWNS